MSDDAPSVSQLAGQLGYLFEEEADLRDAPVEQLLERFNREDRFARARAAYPLLTDPEIAEKVGEFADRIDPRSFAEAVRVARARLE